MSIVSKGLPWYTPPHLNVPSLASYHTIQMYPAQSSEGLWKLDFWECLREWVLVSLPWTRATIEPPVVETFVAAEPVLVLWKNYMGFSVSQWVWEAFGIGISVFLQSLFSRYHRLAALEYVVRQLQELSPTLCTVILAGVYASLSDYNSVPRLRVKVKRFNFPCLWQTVGQSGIVCIPKSEHAQVFLWVFWDYGLK